MQVRNGLLKAIDEHALTIKRQSLQKQKLEALDDVVRSTKTKFKKSTHFMELVLAYPLASMRVIRWYLYDPSAVERYNSAHSDIHQHFMVHAKRLAPVLTKAGVTSAFLSALGSVTAAYAWVADKLQFKSASVKSNAGGRTENVKSSTSGANENSPKMRPRPGNTYNRPVTVGFTPTANTMRQGNTYNRPVTVGFTPTAVSAPSRKNSPAFNWKNRSPQGTLYYTPQANNDVNIAKQFMNQR